MDANAYCWGTHQAALCGSKPGRRSVGFVHDHDRPTVTCKQCLKKIEKQGHIVSVWQPIGPGQQELKIWEGE